MTANASSLQKKKNSESTTTDQETRVKKTNNDDDITNENSSLNNDLESNNNSNNHNNDDGEYNDDVFHDSTGSLGIHDLILDEEEPVTAMLTTKKKKTDENDNSYHVTFMEEEEADTKNVKKNANHQEKENYPNLSFYESDSCISYASPFDNNNNDMNNSNKNDRRNAPRLQRFHSWSNKHDEIKEEEAEQELESSSQTLNSFKDDVLVSNINLTAMNHSPNRRRLESKSSDDFTNGAWSYSSSIDDNLPDYYTDDDLSPRNNYKIPTSPLSTDSNFGSNDHFEIHRNYNHTPGGTSSRSVFHSHPNFDHNRNTNDTMSPEEKQKKYAANASHHKKPFSFQSHTDRYTKEPYSERSHQFNDNPKNKKSTNTNKAPGRTNTNIPERMNEYVKRNRILRHHLPLSQISAWIVRHAPCFWCCFCLADLPESSATDRMILIRLNYLCAIFSIVQVGVGIFLCIILFDPTVADRGDENYYLETLTPNLWTLTGMLLLLAVLGSIIFFTMLTTRKLIKEVNLQGSLRFLWVLYWILPLETFFVVALFDSHSVTEVWVRHWWSTAGMAWFREVFCAKDTAHSECVVPWNGGPQFRNESEWCIHNNGTVTTTDCGSIRDNAQKQMNFTSYIFFTVNAIWGVCLVLLLLLAMAMLQGIISTPVVQKSKEANMPVWLTMPTIFSFAAGCILLFSPTSLLSDESGSRFYWIGISYMVAAGTFLVTALLGYFLSTKTVLNTHDNVIKQIAVNIFIVFIFFGIVAVAAVFVASIIYSLNIVSVPFEDDARGAIACVVAATTSECSNCPPLNTTLYGPNDTVCPEWAWEDVLRVIQTQLKSSAIMGGIFLIYALSALRFGFTLRSHINAYEIEYV